MLDKYMNSLRNRIARDGAARCLHGLKPPLWLRISKLYEEET